MKSNHLLTTAIFAGTTIVAPLTAADRPLEGALDPFLGKPRMEQQQLFKNERFPNVVVTLEGTVLATWGSASCSTKMGAYSSLVMVDDQTLGILYESSQAGMVFQKISLADLLNPSRRDASH